MESTYVVFSDLGVVETKNEMIDADNLGPNETIIRSETSIISAGTELARLNGLEYDGLEFPFRPGYGSIGRIIAKGSNIRGFDDGDRVFFAGKHASVQRFSHNQGHQWAHLFPVPEHIDPVEAAVGCMAQIALTAPHLTQVKLGDTAAVFGLGMVGLLTGMLFKLQGARVIGLDPVGKRCALASELGFDEAIDVPSDQQVEALLTRTGGGGANITIDAAGQSSVIANCIQSTALFGHVMLLGSPRTEFETDVNPLFATIHRKGLTVRGAHMFQFPLAVARGVTVNVERNFQTVFELIATRKLDVRPLISHVIRPEQAAEAYEGLQSKRDEYTCVIIDWR